MIASSLRSFSVSLLTVSYTRYTQRWWATCYFAFSKHASGLVIAKLLNEFSIPQRNYDSQQKHEPGKRAGIPRKRHGTRSDAIFMTSYAKHLLCKNPGKIAVIFYCVTVSKQCHVINECSRRRLDR